MRGPNGPFSLLHGRCDQLADAIDVTCSFDPKPVRLVASSAISESWAALLT
jgi:hypothetical protein